MRKKNLDFYFSDVVKTKTFITCTMCLFVSWKKKVPFTCSRGHSISMAEKIYNEWCLLISVLKKKNCIMTLGHIFMTLKQLNNFCD